MLEALAERTTAAPDVAIVRAEALTRRYGSSTNSVDALRGVDLALHAGEFTAIMGPSGSGKSTLMHLLAGLDRPSSGRVVIDGVDIGQLNDRKLTALRRARVGFVFQSFNLLPTLSARRTSSCRCGSPGAGPSASGSTG